MERKTKVGKETGLITPDAFSGWIEIVGKGLTTFFDENFNLLAYLSPINF